MINYHNNSAFGLFLLILKIIDYNFPKMFADYLYKVLLILLLNLLTMRVLKFKFKKN